MNNVTGPLRCNGKRVLKKMNYNENSDETISSDENELSYKENKCENLKKRKRSQQSDDSAKFQGFARSEVLDLISCKNCHQAIITKRKEPKEGIHLKTFLPMVHARQTSNLDKNR